MWLFAIAQATTFCFVLTLFAFGQDCFIPIVVTTKHLLNPGPQGQGEPPTFLCAEAVVALLQNA